ncbi:MAG: MFS transporter [Clostridia bacterium]|nr:MFS transporter [Clostridia bacterium]
MQGVNAASVNANAHKQNGTWLPIILCWLVYMTAYLGRYSYASNITSIIRDFGTSHSDAGMVTTCFFFAYGIGQVLNGILCKHYNKKWMIAGALFVSVTINTAVFIGVPFFCFKYLWLVNGMAQSVLWSTLLCILSETLKKEDLKKAVLVMSTTVSIGTLITYGFSSCMALVGSYSYSFLFGAAAMLISALVWLINYKKAFSSPICKTEDVTENTSKKASYGLWIFIAVFGVLAVANNLIREGLTTWIPSILKENFGLHESLSIILTLILPMLGLFGATCNTLLERRLKSFVSLAGIWYTLSALCMIVVVVFIDSTLWWVVLVSFGLISLFMHGVNNLITSMLPLYMRERANTGLLAGILNGCCYVGSTASSYGLGAVADHFGWNGVIWLLFIICVIAVAVSVTMSIVTSRQGRKAKESACKDETAQISVDSK